MTLEQKQLLNINNFILFLQNNYSLFLPQIVLLNPRYRIYNVIADFDENDSFFMKYEIKDSKENFSTHAEMTLEYDLVLECFYDWRYWAEIVNEDGKVIEDL